MAAPELHLHWQADRIYLQRDSTGAVFASARCVPDQCALYLIGHYVMVAVESSC
jgi:hypothetical protein